MTGSIPPCIFNLPNLQTLHLSGNGFSGMLPNSLPVNLTDLSLSHNFIKGTLSTSIQRMYFSKLDLANNKVLIGIM